MPTGTNAYIRVPSAPVEYLIDRAGTDHPPPPQSPARLFFLRFGGRLMRVGHEANPVEHETFVDPLLRACLVSSRVRLEEQICFFYMGNSLM